MEQGSGLSGKTGKTFTASVIQKNKHTLALDRSSLLPSSGTFREFIMQLLEPSFVDSPSTL